jgi:hypothetical protein
VVEVPYSKEIVFPANPAKADIKNLRRQVAKDQFEVVDGGKTKQKSAGADKTKPTGKKD